MKLFRHPLVATLSVAMLAARLLAPDVWHDCATAMVAGMQAPVVEASSSDAHAGTHHAATGEQESGDSSHDCDCETSCCCVATPATRPDGQSLAPAPVFGTASAPIGVERGWVPPRTDLRLPFNTPPPTSLS
jgi:hypothetical protein